MYRSPMAFGLLLVMPFLLMAVISKAFEPLFEARQTFDVPLIDLDRTDESDRLTADLDGLDGIDIKTIAWDDAGFVPSDADDVLDDEDYFTLIVIPAGYADSLAAGEGVSVSLYSDPAQEAYSGLVEDQVQSQLSSADLVRKFESVLAAETGDPEGAAQTVDSEIEPVVDDPTLTVERVFTEKRKALPGHFEQTVPGFALMFTFWLSVFVAASINSEKLVYNTWKRTLVAPVPRATILASRVVAYVLIGLVQMTALFGLSALVLGLRLGDHPYALLPVFLAVGLVTTGFGVLMTTFIKDFGALNSVMNLAIVLLAAAGGTLVPLFLLPDWLRAIAPLTPHYWAMDASQNLILLNDGLVDILPQTGILLAFAAGLFALGLYRFRFVE